MPAAISADGKLTVGIVGAGDPPLAFLADDNSTVVGSEVDIASLVAESLGLELDVRNISWEQWPLSVQSGDVEAVFSNVGVNAERLQLFDFATYRAGDHGASPPPRTATLSIKEAEDIAGLTVAVGSGTNQERILLDWNKQNEAAGLAARDAGLLRQRRRRAAGHHVRPGRRLPRAEPERGLPGEQGRGLGRRHGQRRLAEHHLRRGHHAQGQRPGRRGAGRAAARLRRRQLRRHARPLGAVGRVRRRAGGQPAGGVLTRSGRPPHVAPTWWWSAAG